MGRSKKTSPWRITCGSDGEARAAVPVVSGAQSRLKAHRTITAQRQLVQNNWQNSCLICEAHIQSFLLGREPRLRRARLTGEASFTSEAQTVFLVAKRTSFLAIGINSEVMVTHLKKMLSAFSLFGPLLAAGLVAGCFASGGMSEIRAFPYPLVYEDESLERFADAQSDTSIEVRKAKISRPLDNLAIHYQALFPGGEIIRPGDHEEYLKIDGKNAYKVVFRTKYMRKRKRIFNQAPEAEVPPGWTRRTIEDPVSGKPIPVLYGPVVPQEKILYLVEGSTCLYYVLMSADGDAIEPARKRFEKFVREDVQYL